MGAADEPFDLDPAQKKWRAQRAKLKVEFGNKERPRCFDSDEQWWQWLALERMAPTFRKHGFCQDCLPSYQDRMRAEGRCAYTYTTFKFVHDKETDTIEIVGFRDPEQIKHAAD